MVYVLDCIKWGEERIIGPGDQIALIRVCQFTYLAIGGQLFVAVFIKSVPGIYIQAVLTVYPEFTQHQNTSRDVRPKKDIGW